jgi:hypothetical protein
LKATPFGISARDLLNFSAACGSLKKSSVRGHVAGQDPQDSTNGLTMAAA